MVLLLVLALSTSTRATRVIYDLDHDWKFELQGGRPSGRCNGTDPFPQDLGTKQTSGLNQASAITESTCADACCGETSCETYQFCNVSSCGCGPPQQACCWIGKYTGAHTSTAKGWVSRARTVAPTPSPGPGPAATCSEAWCLPTTDDSKWRDVAIPHDFVVEGTFSETLGDKVHGYLPYGVGFYRKHLTLPSAHSGLIAGTHVATLVFDGVQTASKTYLDGEELGTHASGYTPFRYVLSAATAARLGSGASVLLAVEADATKPDGWWYDGGGIYRHVKLVVQPALHLAVHGGVYAPSLVVGAIDSTHPQLVADGVVMPSLTVVNADSAAASAVTVKCVVADAAGKAVGMVSSSIASIAAGKNVTTALQNITLPSAQLWSVEAPYLYTITCTVNNDDAVATKIGVRKTTWSADTGFWLNDVNVKIKGNANHQDFAGVGVAVPDILQAHRIAKLQEMGANGWRTAHNPPNPALLDAADAMGFLVWDENHRNGQDGELTDLVLRDRNHPCVVIWSICNEKLCKTGGDTLGDAQRMHDLFHTLDPHGQRPVSANYNGWDTTMTPLDLDGFDYETSTYDKNHKAVPNVPSISSETSSAVSDRGYYAADDATTGHVKGYDSDHPGWGQTAEDAWGGVTEPANQGILTRAFVAGAFIFMCCCLFHPPSLFLTCHHHHRRLYMDRLGLQGRADAIRVAEHQLALWHHRRSWVPEGSLLLVPNGVQELGHRRGNGARLSALELGELLRIGCAPRAERADRASHRVHRHVHRRRNGGGGDGERVGLH